jgi:hypothetical protein
MLNRPAENDNGRHMTQRNLTYIIFICVNLTRLTRRSGSVYRQRALFEVTCIKTRVI